jgi:hypothetical protein
MAAKRQVHFKDQIATPVGNDKICYTQVEKPNVTNNPDQVTCKQCKYMMMLNRIKRSM